MKRVLLGISGGVDSSAAAILLKEQGYEVIGITFRFTEDFDESDAVKVCQTLNIEHHILDYIDIFKEKIIERFISDYNRGITPNPCFICNREVKFNFLYENMKKFNCDYIATGHYAKIKDNRLYISADLKKDQTYFLGQLSKEQLAKLVLPLEGITKEEVREIATRYELVNANRKDSTDVCFITSNFKDYMNKKMNMTVGDIIEISTGNIIGKHQGLVKYTIGQRRGLNIGGTKDRLYVVGKDPQKNILYVALGDDNEYLTSTSCLITNFNLIGNKVDCAKARFRYRQPLVDVEIIYKDDTNVIIKYPQGVASVTPGQACVLYLDDECLGGGIIKEVYKKEKRVWYI